MGRDISLMVSVKDNYSSAITKMASTTRMFEADMEGLSAKLKDLNANKTTLQVDATKARNELQAAKKAFSDTGNEVDRLNLEAKQTDYNNIVDNLKLVSDQVKQTEKDMRSLTDELSKTQNRAGTGGLGAGVGESSTLGALGKAGIFATLSDSLSRATDSLIGSALGDNMGDMVSSVLSKAAMGAAAGSIIPGVGTAIGAAVGVASGVVDGAVQIFEKKNDAFKNTVQAAYEGSQETQAEMLTAGSELAAARQTSLVSWTTMLGGDAEKAKNFTDEIKDMANVTPFVYEDLNVMARTLKTFGYEMEEILPTLTKIGDAGASLGMGVSDISMMATALGRMRITDKTTTEYLNLLIERGIPAYEYLAESMGKTEGEIIDMVSKGLIPGSQAAQIIADAMGSDFAGGMAEQSKTFEGLASTLQGARDELNVAMGEGFNAVRSKGMSEEISFLSGETGAKMMEVNRMIGEWQASLVNQQEQYQRDAITAVMDGTLGAFANSDVAQRLQTMHTEYMNLLEQVNAGNEEAGAKAGALLAEAQVIANNEYMAGDGYRIQLEANKSLVKNLQSDTGLNEDYYNAGLTLGEQLSKGVASALESSLAKWSSGQMTVSNVKFGMPSGKNNAWGQKRVPYDNYPAVLHQNERVLTASEAANADKSSGGGVTVQILGGVSVREEADIYKVAQELAREIALAREVVIYG